MSSRPARASRLPVVARGVGAAGVATLAATVGHAVSQQALPSTWIVVLAFALAAPVCVALAGRRLSVPRLAVAVALSQLAFHLLLRLDFIGPSPAAGSGHGAMTAVTTTTMTMTDAVGAAGHDLSPTMWIGHALAAAVTVLVLAAGEASVAALVALIRRPFRALATVSAPTAVAPLRIVESLGIRPSLLLAGVVRRRGPPALV